MSIEFKKAYKNQWHGERASKRGILVIIYLDHSDSSVWITEIHITHRDKEPITSAELRQIATKLDSLNN